MARDRTAEEDFIWKIRRLGSNVTVKRKRVDVDVDRAWRTWVRIFDPTQGP